MFFISVNTLCTVLILLHMRSKREYPYIWTRLSTACHPVSLRRGQTPFLEDPCCQVVPVKAGRPPVCHCS